MDDKQYITLLKKRHSRVDLNDIVYMTYDECEEIIIKNGGEIPINEEELILKPALKNFAIYDREANYFTLYLEPEDKSRIIKYGSKRLKPIIEISTLLKDTEGPQNIIVLCRENDNGSLGTIALKTLRNDKEDVCKMQHMLLKHYFMVQTLLYNRPEIFKKTTERMTFNMSMTGNERHPKDRKRVVKMVKVLHIDQGEIEKLVKAHREMTCPCWGVIGHWRRYKSGKKVWIEPYRKGKKRNDPKAYSPKEYRRMEA